MKEKSLFIGSPKYNLVEDFVHHILSRCPVGQVGLAYYNIPDPSTQGTNQVSTNHQEAAPAGVVMSRQFRVHLNRLKELLQIRYNTILDCQYSMCNSRRGKIRAR